jgi:DNA-binding CsgD family transcriptional regulator
MEEIQEFVQFAKDETVLSDREAEVWVHSQIGESSDDIAKTLGISEKTINRHKSLARKRIEDAVRTTELNGDTNEVWMKLGSESDTLEVWNTNGRSYTFQATLFKVLTEDGTRFSLVVEDCRNRSGDEVITREYNAETESGAIKKYVSGSGGGAVPYSTVEEAKIIYSVLDSAFSLNSFAELYPDTGELTEERLRFASRNTEYLDYKECEELLPSDSGNAIQPFLGHNSVGIPYFMDPTGSQVMLAGKIGSGKSYATKLFIERIKKSDDPIIVMIDPLNTFEDFTEYLDGTSIDFSEDFDLELVDDVMHIDISASEASKNLGDVFNSAIDEVGKLARNADRPVCVVMDEAHYLSPATRGELWEKLGGDENLYSVLSTTQSLSEFDSFENDVLGSDGLVLFKMEDFVGESFSEEIPSDLVNYVRHAQPGTADVGYSEALVFPPGSSSGTPVRVYPEQGEIKYSE